MRVSVRGLIGRLASDSTAAVLICRQRRGRIHAQVPPCGGGGRGVAAAAAGVSARLMERKTAQRAPAAMTERPRLQIVLLAWLPPPSQAPPSKGSGGGVAAAAAGVCSGADSKNARLREARNLDIAAKWLVIHRSVEVRVQDDLGSVSQSLGVQLRPLCSSALYQWCRCPIGSLTMEIVLPIEGSMTQLAVASFAC